MTTRIIEITCPTCNDTILQNLGEMQPSREIRQDASKTTKVYRVPCAICGTHILVTAEFNTEKET